MQQLYLNNAESTLLGVLHPAGLTLLVQVADAAKFPNPVVGSEYFKLTLVSKNTGAKEIVHCTQRVTNTLTIVRAQEATVALDFAIGDIVALRVTKETVEKLSSASRQNLTNVVATGDLTLLPGFSTVTGNTQINRLVNTNFAGGQIARFVTTGTPTIKHNTAGVVASRPILTKTGADVVMAADKPFSAVYDEVANVFREV